MQEPTDSNTRFIQELGYHGMMFGSDDSAVEDGLEADVVRYVVHPSAPTESGIDLHEMFPDLDMRQTALALVSGARHAAARAREIEVAAARLARLLQPPVTLRELASAADITERAAATRYSHYSTPASGTHLPITAGMVKGGAEGLRPKEIPMAALLAKLFAEGAPLLDEDDATRP